MKRKYNWLNHLFNFIAVILGVYLAFYINEKAKLSQDRNEGSTLMYSLIGDLSDDIKTYETYQIPENIQHQKRIGNLLNSLTAGNIDSASNQLLLVFQVENFEPTTSTYGSMKSSGKLGLIEDLALRKKLTGYYEVVVQEGVAKGEYQADFFVEELLTWIIQNFDLSEMKILNKGELTILKNKLIIYESLIDQKVEAYEMIVKDSKQLKASVESVLSRQ